MRLSALLILLAASVSFGQTPAKPATAPAGTTPKTSTTTAKPAATPASTVKKPASDMPLLHGIVKPLFSERYEDIKIGTGAVAEPYKIYHVNYSGYLAATGQKFDSSFDHRVPVMKDGKPVLGDDGKPQLGDPQPMVFQQGVGRLIPGFDQGLAGMHIGGKRRIFIPWQLAYGMRELPARQGFIGIPAKSDLIFDVELLDVTEVPAAPAQPFGGGAPRPQTPPTPNPNAQPATAPAGSAPATAPTSNSAPATPPPAATTPPK